MREQPGLNQLVITGFTPLTPGLDYRIKVRVFTIEGEVDSDPALITLASVPSKPPTKPTHVIASSTGSKLVITITPLVSSSDPLLDETGGSPILSYTLEIDNGSGGAYTSLGGAVAGIYQMATSFTITQNITRGSTYRLRYKAYNKYGWSPYSEVTYALAA